MKALPPEAAELELLELPEDGSSAVLPGASAPEPEVVALTASPTWAVTLEMTPVTGAVRTAAFRLFWAVSTWALALETCACCCWMVAGRLTDWPLYESCALVSEFCACWRLRCPAL